MYIQNEDFLITEKSIEIKKRGAVFRLLLILSLQHIHFAFLPYYENGLFMRFLSVHTANEYSYVMYIFCRFSFLETRLNSICRTGHMTLTI